MSTGLWTDSKGEKKESFKNVYEMTYKNATNYKVHITNHAISSHHLIKHIFPHTII